MGAVVLGDDHEPGCVLVEAVDDAWADGAANALQVGTVGEHGIDERAVRVSWRRVDGQPGRLVHYEKVVVFVDDGKRYVLRFKLAWRRFGHSHDDRLPLSRLRGRLGGTAIQDSVAFADECLYS